MRRRRRRRRRQRRRQEAEDQQPIGADQNHQAVEEGEEQVVQEEPVNQDIADMQIVIDGNLLENDAAAAAVNEHDTDQVEYPADGSNSSWEDIDEEEVVDQ